MFKNLTIDEKNVLNLFIKADKDEDYRNCDFIRELENMDNDYKITEYLYNLGYVYMSVNRGLTGYIETQYEWKNNHIVSETILNNWD